MKLQHLVVIFVVIILPISLIISAYTQKQIDTLILQEQYDSKLLESTYNAMKAFDMNTSGNDLSNVADTIREDILAAISTFMTSFATTIGVPGYQEAYIKPYIPAILFTLYDGYYIYAPTQMTKESKNSKNGKYEYTLQPYNFYSVRYKTGNIDVVINYTLNNYIVVYGFIGNEYVTKSGYLVAGGKTVKKETINEYVPKKELNGTTVTGANVNEEITVTDEKWTKENTAGETGDALYPRNSMYYIDSESASKYYKDAEDFTTWVKSKLGYITPKDAMLKSEPIEKFSGDNTRIFNLSSANDPEDPESDFNKHRTEVMQTIIEDNLNYVISAYADSLGGIGENNSTYNYRLPEMNLSEWQKIASNVSMVSFVQGMPVGTRFYNNYAIVTSTTNKLFIDPDNIYYINQDQPENTRSYHKIDCPHLGTGNIVGFSSYSFQTFEQDVKETSSTLYYYRHRETACYYCIVDNNYTPVGISGPREIARDTAVAREKYRLYTTTNYFGTN